MNRRRAFGLSAIALSVGLALLIFTLRRVDLQSLSDLTRSLGIMFPLVLLPSTAWHVLRTAAWCDCFPLAARPRFWRAFRVRLAAEAFSFLTIRGVAGEPLKVVLLNSDVSPSISAAAIALERLVYTGVTALIVSIGSLVAIAALPLSSAWIRVFAVFAGFGVAIVALAVVLLRRAPARPRTPSGADTGRWGSGVAKGIEVFRNQLQVLVHDQPERLLRLVVLETIVFFTMALEVWIALRLARTPIGAIGALAAETFTRVTSVASAFIPGNLGALEISNIGAANAVQVGATGATALALVRRARGLFWCAGGFLIYPRVRPRRGTVDPAATGLDRTGQKGTERSAEDPALAIIETDAPAVSLSHRLGGLAIGERILGAAIRAGYARLLVWTPNRTSEWQGLRRRFAGDVDVALASDEPAWRCQLATLDPQASVAVLAPGIVPSPQLLAAARLATPAINGSIVEVPSGRDWPHSGAFSMLPRHLERPDRLASLLRIDVEEPPIAAVAAGDARLSLRVLDADDLVRAERRLRQSAFKSTDGRLGRFNRRLSLPISIMLIRWMRFSPHVMSVLVMMLGFVAGWLFSRGSYATGLLAAVVSWGASVLDGCDGELARLQFRETTFGCWFDTLGDYTYYLAIFVGLTIGAVHQTGWSGYWWIGGALLAGTVITLGLLVLLRQRITGKRPELLRTNAKAHFYATGKTWAHVVAKLSTCATRATAPYGILALAVLGLLPAVVILSALGAQIYWISLTVELRRLLDGAPQPSPRAHAHPAVVTSDALASGQVIRSNAG